MPLRRRAPRKGSPARGRKARGVRVYLARHGETTWNAAGRYQGRLESPLSERGVRQANALAAAMERSAIARVVSSPLARCTETARPSAERLQLALETDARLIEIAHGTWEGRLREEIAANDPQRYRAWREDPANVAFENGETIVQVLERWRDFAAAGRDLMTFWNGRVENGAYATFEVEGARWTLLAESDVSHLGALRASTEGQAL